MKKNLLIAALLMLFATTFSGNRSLAQEIQNAKTRVDVYYFHSTKRCPTCEAIERETKKTLNGSFSDQTANGTVKLHILDLDQKENKNLVEKHEIYGSSLILIPTDGGEVVNLTNKAFLYALDQSFAFRRELREKLNELLK
jgi:hypothetical protein